MLAQMYADKLRKEGFAIDIAHTGREGLAKMRTEHPSLVLMDILMPETDGLSALRQAKADAKIRKIPILMLTNLSDSDYARQAVREGAVDFLVKTETTPTDVVNKIKDILDLPAVEKKS